MPADAGAEDVDVFAACHLGRLFDRLLRASHERVDAPLGHFGGLATRDDEGRGTYRTFRSIRAPPRQRGVVGAPAGDARPEGPLALGQNLTALLIVAVRPLVQLLSAVAHRLLVADTRRGHETVQGHAYVEDHLAHLGPLCSRAYRERV